MNLFWAEHAVLPTSIAHGVRIEEDRGRVLSVTPDAPPAGTILPGLVLPGFANGHSHAFHRALRGTTHADGGSFWSWRERMYAVAGALTPENYRELATAVFAEMVLAGYTVVGEFHYVHHLPDGTAYEADAMEQAILSAAADAGIRLTLLDTLYLEGGIDIPISDRQRRFSDGSVQAWHRRRSRLVPGRRARIGAALHSVRGVTPAAIAEVVDLDLDLLHAHVSEQPAENEQAIERWGSTPVRLLADLLGPRFTAVHATHLVDDDVAALSTGFACICPTTERDLGDGIGPARALHDAGVRLTLGSDQNAVVDPFEEIRGLEMNERLASGERGRFAPRDLLEAAGANGYASLGWDVAAIAPGALCDLVAVDDTSTRTAGSDPGQMWLTASAADVREVVVDGELVVTGGVHRLGDIASLLSAAIGRVRP
ncbi:formimidoylglutamate deiminase [Amnibacterium flavum]|uniref:Formimidoylglutamate deiminase n=1 Tax=Amnibacterium flavum TaxID=2173173 RepID=A0A2V1HQF9_9MICO|nr:formimidoylglutamate deiminase [Amnibacterium flavum]PVZ94768.1 formimidoylglutamate deiminase [Amnibacterium flavum]